MYAILRNMRIWKLKRPHAFEETSLHTENVGVWVAFSGKRLVKPIFKSEYLLCHLISGNI